MKQKYKLTAKSGKGEFIVEEFAELEPGKFFSMCKGTYDLDEMKKAAEIGLESVVLAFRTASIFPDMAVSLKIAEGITSVVAGEEESIEVAHDDSEALKVAEAVVEEKKESDETVELDLLLDDDEEDDEFVEDMDITLGDNVAVDDASDKKEPETK